MTSFWCAHFVNHVSVLTSLHHAFPTQMKASVQVGAIADTSIPLRTFPFLQCKKKGDMQLGPMLWLRI